MIRFLKQLIFSTTLGLSLGLTTPSVLAFNLNQLFGPQPKSNTFTIIAQHLRSQAFFDQPLVEQQIAWYLHNPAYLKILSQNANLYLYYVYKQTEKRHMPPIIALLPMIESNYNPFLYSSQGATGLWQFMPGTATGLGIKINWWFDGRRSIVQSTNTALDYLEYLHHYLHNWLLAIAAYNSGAGTIEHAVKYNRRYGRPTDYWHLALPAETKAYVPKLLALAAIIADPHGRTLLPAIDYHPTFSEVKLSGQYNISYLAKLCHISADTLRFYNPGFRRFATGPMENTPFLIPFGQRTEFLTQLNKKSHYPSLTWQHHMVKAGDNLITLAHRYHTTPNIIKRVNHLKSDELHLKQSLLIPQTHHYQLLSKIDQAADIAENHLPGPKLVQHVVKPRESIWSIAARYHVKTQDIRFWNHLSRHTHLYPNRVITIWARHRIPKEHDFLHMVKAHDSLIGLLKNTILPPA